MLLLAIGCLVKSSKECSPIVPGEVCAEADSATPSDSPADSQDSAADSDSQEVTWVAELVGKDRHFASIQDAIVDASDGDVVLVQPGTHYERIDFHGKGIHILSAEGAEATVLDGSGEGSVVEMRAMEPTTAILEGFTITNGEGTEAHGGGIFIENADGVIQHNVIVGNRARIGGGVYLRHGAATVRNNLIVDNHAEEGGGGLTCTNCRGLVTYNTFVGNDAPNGAFAEWFFEVEGDIVSNIIVHDLEHPPEFAIRFMEPRGYTFEVVDNLMYPEVPWIEEGLPWGHEWPGDEGTIYADPLFVDAEGGDYRLQEGSPGEGRGAFAGDYGDWSPSASN